MGTVTLLGAGLMGTAVGNRLLARGHELHVWNRTPSKLIPLERSGAHIHTDVATALACSDTIVLLLSGHAVAWSLISELADQLRGKDVLDLMTGDATDAQSLFSRCEAAGAYYLNGVIENFPGSVGTAEALMYVSGDESVWSRQSELLFDIAPATHFVGAQIAAASQVDAGLAGAFSTVAMCAWMEALAYLSDAGFDLTNPAFDMAWWIRQLARDMANSVEEVRTRNFSTKEATLAVNAAALAKWRNVLVEGGQRADIMTAALHNLERAMAAGLGEQSWSAQIHVARGELSS